MTTIAYDGKTLCIDSQTTTEVIHTRTTKKMWLDVGDFPCVAMCGNSADWAPALQWLRDGAKPNEWGSCWDVAAWAVTKSGKVERYVRGHPESVTSPDSDGSGAEIALGAMAAGATARQAMKIARGYDLYTGGKIRAYKILAQPK